MLLGDDPLAVDLDAVVARVGLRAELRDDAAVYAHTALGDELLCGTARGDAAAARIFWSRSPFALGLLSSLFVMRRVEKPWGHEIIWAETDWYVAKLLHIVAGHKLSRQYHERKDETFYVQTGEMDSRSATRPSSGRCACGRATRSTAPHGRCTA